MYKSIILTLPIVVTLFWGVKLHLGRRKDSYIPKSFLGRFMICAFFLYCAHLLYYIRAEGFFLFIEPFYQFFSLMVYPMFHVYIRLLTVDDRFSLKRHGRFFATPALVAIIYLITSVIAPYNEYRSYLFENVWPESVAGLFYYGAVWLVKVVFLVQVLLYVAWNYVLLRKYGYKAEHFYSNISQSRVVKANLLNLVMLIIAFSSMALNILGRQFFIDNTLALTAASVIFSFTLFFIGWIGNMQQLINPLFEKEEKEQKQEQEGPCAMVEEPLQIYETARIDEVRRELGMKIDKAMREDKVFLNPNLNIKEMSAYLGSNRTYVSNYINSKKNVSFCVFVNKFRYKELESILLSDQRDHSAELLALRCGFGSVDSMKRTVKNESGMAFKEWRESLKYKDVD